MCWSPTFLPPADNALLSAAAASSASSSVDRRERKSTKLRRIGEEVSNLIQMKLYHHSFINSPLPKNLRTGEKIALVHVPPEPSVVEAA
jgi:hypothetical protein